MALTAKQQRFVDEYLIDLNATQAAIRAGYSQKTARQIGNRMLTNVDIQSAIAKRMGDRSGRVEITQDMVLRELAKIGFSDIRKVVRWGETQVRMVDGEDDGPEDMVPYHGLALIDSTEVTKPLLGSYSPAMSSADRILSWIADPTGAVGFKPFTSVRDSLVCRTDDGIACFLSSGHQRTDLTAVVRSAFCLR